MDKTMRDKSARNRPNSKKALEILRELRSCNLPERFHGMTKEQIIREIKKSREAIWREKLPPRP